MSYQEAKQKYAAIGVDTDAAIARLKTVPISLHCWQGDDVLGFEGAGALTGGIQTTGNYPGAARNPKELMADFDVVLSLVPGTKRINLHAIYAISDTPVELDKLEYRHFEKWVEYAKERNLGIDFNPTLFSHPMVVDGLTLSSPKKEVREFWIKHVKACRAIAAKIGQIQGTPCLNNIWIPDGFKDVPADRLGPRQRLKESLDEIFSVKYPSEYIVDSVESKVFGIGVESYTVGSNEFYQNYAAKNGVCCLLDNGHYHPLEYVSDKIPALLAFYDKVALHVTRGVRWDSDHVVILNDSVQLLAQEIVWADALNKVNIGLDYFDASINRIGAYVIGSRATQKAFLQALLSPIKQLRDYESSGRFFQRLALLEESKSMPWAAVYDYFCLKNNAPAAEDYIATIEQYEKEVTSKR